jgi:hypothetical protein
MTDPPADAVFLYLSSAVTEKLNGAPAATVLALTTTVAVVATAGAIVRGLVETTVFPTIASTL